MDITTISNAIAEIEKILTVINQKLQAELNNSSLKEEDLKKMQKKVIELRKKTKEFLEEINKLSNRNDPSLA